MKCKIKMSKFCGYDELECLQEHNNLVRFSGVPKSTFGEKNPEDGGNSMCGRGLMQKVFI